jgi:hypothetical protein
MCVYTKVMGIIRRYWLHDRRALKPSGSAVHLSTINHSQLLSADQTRMTLSSGDRNTAQQTNRCYLSVTSPEMTSSQITLSSDEKCRI